MPAFVVIEPDGGVLAVGYPLQLTARVYDANGATVVGQRVVWKSNDPSAATIDSTGMLTPVAPPTTKLRSTGVSATVGAIVATAVFYVNGTPAAALSGQIAFVSTRNGGQGQIYFAHSDGSVITRLTNDSTQDTQPAWSPDGEKIAFTRTETTGPKELWVRELWVMNADGSGLRRVHAGGRTPSWSPDGSRIAFATSQPGVPSQIAVMNADGSNVEPLTKQVGVAETHDDTWPAWSPDGSQIAFVRTWNGDFEGGPPAVHVMNADGSGERALNNNYPTFYAEGPPSWSPDGRRILFWSFWSQPGFAIADGVGLGYATQIAGIVRGYPTGPAAWSPDGARIAFSTGYTWSMSGFGEDDGPPELYVMNADGSGAVRLPVGPDGDQPAWRPRH